MRLNHWSKQLLSIGLILLGAGIAQAEVCKTDQILPSTPDSRFSDQFDGTVLDTVTGLVWQRCALGFTWDGSTCQRDELSPLTYTWEQALLEATAAGGTWRLPTIKELQSIIEYQCYGPPFSPTIFPASPTGTITNFPAEDPLTGYWSATPTSDADGSTFYTKAWFVDAYAGYIYFTLKTNRNFVRLVKTF